MTATLNPTYPSDTTAAMRHSGLGIASVAIAVVAGVASFALIVIAGIMEATTPGGMDEDSPAAILIGLLILGMVALSLVGGGLALAGLFQPYRYKVIPILGLCLNAAVAICVIGLIAIGLMMG